MAAFVMAPFSAHATTIPQFDGKTVDDKLSLIKRFINKMADDVSEKDTALAQQIRDYFLKKLPATGNYARITDFSARSEN